MIWLITRVFQRVKHKRNQNGDPRRRDTFQCINYFIQYARSAYSVQWFHSRALALSLVPARAHLCKIRRKNLHTYVKTSVHGLRTYMWIGTVSIQSLFSEVFFLITRFVRFGPTSNMKNSSTSKKKSSRKTVPILNLIRIVVENRTFSTFAVIIWKFNF